MLLANLIQHKHTKTFDLSPSSKNKYGIDHEKLAIDGQPIVSIKDLKLRAKHQIENALATIAIIDIIGIDRQVMISTLKTFNGLPHRCEFVAKINGVTYINDSKATNVSATIAAIEGLAGNKNIILILGGEGKNQDFSPLKAPIKKHVKHLFLIGKAKKEISAAINQGNENQKPHNNCDIETPKHRNTQEIQNISSLKDVINKAKFIAKKNDIVLLSPACASFDMFKNFEHRGDEFKKQVSLFSPF